jgi:hypothetical protein
MKAKKQEKDGKTIFSLSVYDEEGVLNCDIAFTQDCNGRLWLEDQPLTVIEARHFWAFLEYALPEVAELDRFRLQVRNSLHDAGTMQAVAAGRHG